MELVGLDFLHFDLHLDHYTGFTQAYPTASKKANTATERLYSDFMFRLGLPDKILHDQGGEFENDLPKELAKLCGVKRIRTTPYYPQNNEKVYRMNQTIISMLLTLPELHKSKWKDYIQKLVFAYNCTKHSRTGYSP